ncbi:hypothetical protein GCM10027515_13750 [Schumannella luteola]|uniref:Glycosyltransferase n=1 Tax=Schumannella luteola TaxID=472059 RepID=A0A852Y9C8_9MICO|nr:DUF6716 putative glycosyltransferase [Schumannella luteola]NYG97821.1 hypothetical protein [Schumannella luteola]TPX02918.1 hypothetical protein FJ656_19855 [Schumannella luteola]
MSDAVGVAGASTPTGKVAPARRRLLAIADSDSYVKWGASLVDRLSDETWDIDFLVLRSPLQPSATQLVAAVADTRWAATPPEVIDFADFAQRVADLDPDAVLLATRGPVVKVMLRAALAVARRRPIFVTGLPGISIPATRKAIAYRSQSDLMVLHSEREIRDFGKLADKMTVPQRFGLASLPFFPPADDIAEAGVPGGPIVFASQAKVPADREDRVQLLGWLAETARRNPGQKVVIKVRAAAGEAQTHAEQWDYSDLMRELPGGAPSNLVVEGGAMSKHLATASGLVTVSSTAAIEAIGLGVPVLLLDDFGVSKKLINKVFVGSGVLAPASEMIAGRFRRPHPEWLDDNYFHPASSDDWEKRLLKLIRKRDNEKLKVHTQHAGTTGGTLREAWDRKRALGSYDRTLSGYVALLVGSPFAFALRCLGWGKRRAKRVLKKVRRMLRPNGVGAAVPVDATVLPGGAGAAASASGAPGAPAQPLLVAVDLPPSREPRIALTSAPVADVAPIAAAHPADDAERRTA